MCDEQGLGGELHEPYCLVRLTESVLSARELHAVHTQGRMPWHMVKAALEESERVAPALLCSVLVAAPKAKGPHCALGMVPIE